MYFATLTCHNQFWLNFSPHPPPQEEGLFNHNSIRVLASWRGEGNHTKGLLRRPHSHLTANGGELKRFGFSIPALFTREGRHALGHEPGLCPLQTSRNICIRGIPGGGYDAKRDEELVVHGGGVSQGASYLPVGALKNIYLYGLRSRWAAATLVFL